MTEARILVVDDNRDNRTIAAAHLAKAGFSILEAQNGVEALGHFAACDLVLLDVFMPLMDGFEACRRMRATGSDKPILFMTAMGDVRTCERAIETGADDFLTKPLHRVELLLRVRALLRLHRLAVELRERNAVIASQRDVLLQLQENRRRLLAMIVHDLKSPLATLVAGADFLSERKELKGEDLEALSDIRASSDLLHRMVMDLLDVDRAEDGKLVPRCKPTPLRGLLEEVATSVRPRVRSSGRALVIEASDGIVDVDVDLARRVIENLLDNSFKYAPYGTEVRVEGRIDGESAFICVRDQGPGIPPELREHIFEMYARVELDDAHTRTSRGLGLAFCRLAVEAHGGKLWVEANHPKGSAFYIRLPRAEA